MPDEVAHYHIIGKKEDGSRQEIIAVDEVNGGSLWVEIIGEYDNKLYYTDNNGFAYVDLSSDKFERKAWIDYNEEKSDYNIEREGFFIGNGKMYFCASGKIYSLNINDKSLDDAELFAEGYIYNTELNDQKKLFYANDDGLYSLDLITGKSKILVKNDDKSHIDADNYYIGTSEIYYETDEGLYSYNMNSGDNKLIDAYTNGFTMKNDEIYYIKDEKIIKFFKNKKEIVYKNAIDGSSLEYLSSYEDILEVNFRYYADPVDGGSMDKYIVNGEIQDKTPTISVKMKDGNEKEFSIDLIENKVMNLI